MVVLVLHKDLVRFDETKRNRTTSELLRLVEELANSVLGLVAELEQDSDPINHSDHHLFRLNFHDYVADHLSFHID